MTISQHIATSSLLSTFTSIPIIGVAIGFISHAIFDLIEPQEYSINLLKPDISIIITESILSLLILWFARNNSIMLCTIVGGIAPDLIDAILVLFDRNRYKKGEHLFWFHKAKKQKELTKKQTILLSLLLFIFVLFL